MLNEVARIPLQDLSWDVFHERFYGPERPVVITGCAVDPAITVEHLRDTYMDPETRDIGWYDSALPADGADSPIVLPSLVTQMFEQDDVAVRPLPMRVWVQPNGHKSLMHYDGNSLCGFNLQVRGSKEWTLIPPDAGLRCAPFNFVALVNSKFEPADQDYDVYRFYTEPGDMVFLPRYWIHGVETRADVNINVNWVWTPTYPNASSELGTREVELLRLRQIMPVFDRLMGDAAASYGGGGASIVDSYVESVSRSSALKRLGKELALVPRMAVNLPSLLGELKTFSNNNFNVERDVAG